MPFSSPKIIVTGATGLLGYRFCRMFAGHYDIFGVSRSVNTRHDTHSLIPGIQWIGLDLDHPSSFFDHLHAIQPDTIIHLAAASDPNFCEDHPKQSRIINVTFTRALGQWCFENKVALIFASSDLVFDGQSAPYTENSPLEPLSVYGRQKQEAEDILLHMFSRPGPPLLIIRLPLMFGIHPSSPKSLHHLIQKLSDGQTAPFFTDEFRTPLVHLMLRCTYKPPWPGIRLKKSFIFPAPSGFHALTWP